MNAFLAPVASRKARIDALPPSVVFAQLDLFNDWFPRVAPPQGRDSPEPRSKLMKELLRILRRVARAGAPAPTNPILAEQTASVRQSTARAIRMMERDGFFKVQTARQQRRIVFPDGMATDWGAFREGHPPGPPGSAKPKPPKMEPLVASRTPIPPPSRIDMRPPAVCQFPAWGDDEKPPANIDEAICGQSAVHGESWCLAHLAVVSPKRAAKHVRLLSGTSLCCNSPHAAP